MADTPEATPDTVEARTLDSFHEVVPDYYLGALRDLETACGSLAGKRVLEIGGSSLPSELVLGVLGARQWVCVDILDHASGRYQLESRGAHYREIGILPLEGTGSIPERPYVIYDGSAEFIPPSFEGQFDIVFSVNSFEHIAALTQVLERAHACLRGDGSLFSQFGPIWSCHVGSHFWVREDFNFNHPQPLPPWAHLRLSREQVAEHLRRHGQDDETVHNVLYQFFESGFVNRRFYEDYQREMAGSPFAEHRIEPMWSTPVSPTYQIELEALYPGHREFGAYGMRIVARRASRRAAAQLLVCGAGRSGTSALAGMVDQGTHFHGENLFPASPSNPKGFFENYDINDLNEELLLRSARAHLGTEGAQALYGRLERGQYWLARWPDGMPLVRDEDLQQRVRGLVQRQPLCFKDPRFAHTAPAWLAELPDATLLCIFRPPAVTAQSILDECRTAGYLRRFRISVDDAFSLWLTSYRNVVRLYAQGARVLFVRYADLFDSSRLAALEALLGLPLVRDFAERTLDRTASRLQPDAASEELYALLDALAAARFGTQREALMPIVHKYLSAGVVGPRA